MKVDMATGKALWATNEGMTSPAGRQYANAVATTASGHVVVMGYQRRAAGRMAIGVHHAGTHAAATAA